MNSFLIQTQILSINSHFPIPTNFTNKQQRHFFSFYRVHQCNKYELVTNHSFKNESISTNGTPAPGNTTACIIPLDLDRLGPPLPLPLPLCRKLRSRNFTALVHTLTPM